MLRHRVIPVLLLDNNYLYKTIQFSSPEYLGDPINTIKIFNNKEVDEIAVLDISATKENKEPNYDLLEDLATEAFMPMAYGGGLKNLDQIQRVFSIGYEKVVLNTSLLTQPQLIRESVKKYGSQSIVASIDVIKKSNQYLVVTHSGSRLNKINPVDFAKEIEKIGAGEIIINSIDKDGTMTGYDLELVKAVTEAVNIPVVASGGAGKLEDFKLAVDAGASAVAAGSFFVFYGRHRAVLITYPEYQELEQLFSKKDSHASLQ